MCVPKKPPCRTGPSLEQPASYNNCNFYVSEMPKGFPRGNNNNVFGENRCPPTNENSDDCFQPLNNRSSMECEPEDYGPNFPAGDCQPVPPPFGRSWSLIIITF